MFEVRDFFLLSTIVHYDLPMTSHDSLAIVSGAAVPDPGA